MMTDAYRATHDALTDLPNDFLFEDRLNRAVASSERNTHRFVLLYIVFGNYRALHQAQGRQVCDQLIMQIADRLLVSLRDADTIARTDDNRFAVLLTQIKSRSIVSQLILRLQKALTESYRLGSQQVMLDIHLAFGIYPDNGADAKSLIDYVEAALA